MVFEQKKDVANDIKKIVGKDAYKANERENAKKIEDAYLLKTDDERAESLSLNFGITKKDALCVVKDHEIYSSKDGRMYLNYYCPLTLLLDEMEARETEEASVVISSDNDSHLTFFCAGAFDRDLIPRALLGNKVISMSKRIKNGHARITILTENFSKTKSIR